MADESPLRAGWEADTPTGDTVLRDYLASWGEWLEDLAHHCGGRSARDEDVVVTDLGSPAMFFNPALLLRPPTVIDFDAVVSHVRQFYSGASGGRFTWFCAWPTPDLRRHGFELAGHPPFMLRPAGGEQPPVPTGLRIEEVRDADGVAAFDRALVLGFPISELADGGAVYGRGMLDVDGLRIWVGYEGDEPVATASSHLGPTLQHVEWVATRPEYRGRGYGEALTWCATRADPSRPATLIASDDGRPIYERMGFLPVTRLTLWIGSRDGAP